MSRRHADNWSPRSLFGRSIHLTLVTKWSWSWSWWWMTYCHPLFAMSISPPILKYNCFKIWPWKSMVKIMCGQRSRSRLTFKIQRSRSNPLVIFEAWSSIDMFAFRFVAIGPFWLRYSKFYIWPWKFKVKVMAKVKPGGHIWALEFNRYVCFSFHGNRTIFCWDIANSIFDLEKSRSRSRPKSTKI